MRYELPNDAELTYELTEALQNFRNEEMEEIDLNGEGIDGEALQTVYDLDMGDFSVALSYRDTKVFIDKSHIVLTEKEAPLAE